MRNASALFLMLLIAGGGILATSAETAPHDQSTDQPKSAATNTEASSPRRVMQVPGPDVVVSKIGSADLHDYQEYGVFELGMPDEFAVFSGASTSCNIGSAVAEWFHVGNGEGTTPFHPLIAQNLYRYSPAGPGRPYGKFEMIGMSWLKHAFCAVNEFSCGVCQVTNCSTLGLGCADTYSAFRNGTASHLGPRRDPDPLKDTNPLGGILNPLLPAGTHQHPFTSVATGEGRVEVKTADLEEGARYFWETHYITHDEPLDNRYNNASWVEVTIPGPLGPITNTNSFVQGSPAITAWELIDTDVEVFEKDDAQGGRFNLRAKVTQTAPDNWHYEYALHNLNSFLGANVFGLEVPLGVTVSDIGFHDVNYHSDEGSDSDDWQGGRKRAAVVWEMHYGPSNLNRGNALRWGVTFNFRFDADSGPTEGFAGIRHSLEAISESEPSYIHNSVERGRRSFIVGVPVPSSPCGAGMDPDGDGKCDGDDNCPWVWNPDQADENTPGAPGDACDENVGIRQITWLGLDGNTIDDLSRHGAFIVDLPPVDQHLWVNARVNDQWVVQNMVVHPLEIDPPETDPPIQTYRTHFDLGNIAGSPVTEVNAQLAVTFAPLTTAPTGAPSVVVTVLEEENQVGKWGGGIFPQQLLPAPADYVVNASDVDTLLPPLTRNRPNFVVLDSEDFQDIAVVGALANGVHWFRNTYSSSLSEIFPIDLPTLAFLVYGDANALTPPLFIDPSRGRAVLSHFFIEGNAGVSLVDSPGDQADELFSQMSLGSAVVVWLEWPTGARHAASVVGMTRTPGSGADLYTMALRDDPDQRLASTPSGRDLSGPVVFDNAQLKMQSILGEVVIAGWTAARPTEAAIRNAGNAGTNEIRQFYLDHVGDGIDLEEARELLRMARHLKWLADVLVENVFDKEQVSVPAEPSSARLLRAQEILNRHCLLANAAELLFEAGGGGGGLVGPTPLDELHLRLDELDDILWPALLALYPPDADFDDVPDIEDNCAEANPDQADCNTDGLGDACEFDGTNDCNINGTLDECDIAGGDSFDINVNGVPDECEQGDLCNGACVWDIDSSGDVRVPDLITLLGCWGPLVPGGDPLCPCLDTDGSTDIRVPDLIALLAEWGVCP